MFRCSGLPAFRLNYLQETCIIQKNTVLLLEPAARSKLPDCPSLVRTVELDHKTVLSFLNDVNNRLPEILTELSRTCIRSCIL